MTLSSLTVLPLKDITVSFIIWMLLFTPSMLVAQSDYRNSEDSTNIVLLSNTISGRNVLIQDDFYTDSPNQARIPNTNKVFVVQYDYILEENVTIPEGCTLQFDGGSIGGAYTLTGNNTTIIADSVMIFDTNIIVNGTWKTEEAYSEWFGAIGDGQNDDSNAIKRVLKYFKGHTIRFFSNKTYIGANATTVYSNTKIILNGTIKSGSKNGISFEFFDRIASTPGYSGVHNVVICGNGTIDCGGNTYQSLYSPLRIHHCNNILIKDITIKGTYMWHSVEAGGTDRLILDNVTFYSQQYDNAFPNIWLNTSPVVVQLEDIDSSSTSGAIPYDNTPTKNFIARNCKFLIDPYTPYTHSYIGGNHPNDSKDPDGDAVHDILIENCYFQGSKQHRTSAVSFEASAYNIHIRNCTFENLYQGDGCLFGKDPNPEKLRIKNVKVENCEFINCQYGVTFVNVEDGYVENSMFRGSEMIDGDAIIKGEYSSENVEVNKRFRGLQMRNVDNIQITGNEFFNLTLGINGLNPQYGNLRNKNIYIRNNRFRDIATAVVYIQNPSECLSIEENTIEAPLLQPSLEWNWDNNSAVCIGVAGTPPPADSYFVYTVSKNTIKLSNPNCGNIFHKPISYDSVDAYLKDNIVLNKKILTTEASQLYENMNNRWH